MQTAEQQRVETPGLVPARRRTLGRPWTTVLGLSALMALLGFLGVWLDEVAKSVAVPGLHFLRWGERMLL